LERAGFGHPLTWMERSRDKSERDAKQVIMTCMKREYQKYWTEICDEVLTGTICQKIKDQLKVNWKQLKNLMRLFTQI
jgi:hypothetical protein